MLHIGAFRLDLDSEQVSLWHCLTPRTRVLCALLLVFAIALTPNGQWLTWLIYGVGVFVLILISRVTVAELLKRIAVEFIFVGLVLLGTLFRQGGEVVWQWGVVRITTEGLTVLGSVGLKMLLSLSLLNILVLTTSVPTLLNALAALRLPPLLVAILASMYRYIAVMINEFTSMRRAATSRNLLSSKRWQRLVLGNMIGSLFIRTYERGEQVHQAMLARGYTGLPPMVEIHLNRQHDYIALTLVGGLTLLGQALPWILPLRLN